MDAQQAAPSVSGSDPFYGYTLLLLHGTEPDFAWERFVAAVGVLVERLGHHHDVIAALPVNPT